MVRSDDPEVRSNAYLVLGEMGNRSAILMIRDSLGKGMRQVNPARVRIDRRGRWLLAGCAVGRGRAAVRNESVHSTSAA